MGTIMRTHYEVDSFTVIAIGMCSLGVAIPAVQKGITFGMIGLVVGIVLVGWGVFRLMRCH